MLPFTLIEHQFSAASRRGRTYWTRFGFATLAAILCGGLLLSTLQGIPAGRLTGGLAAVLGWPMVLACLLYGTRLTADSLSREKREGTLDLLMLTGLGPAGIVFAKLLSSTITGLSALAAFVPVAAVLMLIDGLNAGQLARLSLALVAILLLALSLGLAVSAFSRDRRTGQNAGLAFVLFSWMVLPVLEQLLLPRFTAWPPEWGPGSASPFLLISTSIAPSPALGLPRFWSGLIVHAIEIGLLLWMATWRLGRSWRHPEGPIPERAPTANQAVPSPPRRTEPLRPLLNRNPFLWLAVRSSQGRIRLGVMMGLGAAAGVGASWWQADSATFLPVALLVTLGTWYLILKISMAESAGKVLFTQRASGALEFLVSTPLGVDDVLRGQRLALARLYRAPVLAFGALATALVTILLAHSASPILGTLERWDTLFAVLSGSVLLIADLIALAWVGMWMGMRLRRLEHVAGAVLARVVFLPGLATFLVSPWITSLAPLDGRRSYFQILVTCWLVLGLLADVILIATARHRLRSRFRELASLVSPDAGPFDRLARRLGAWYARRRRPRR